MPQPNQHTPAPEIPEGVAFFRVRQISKMASVSRAKIFGEIRAGKLRSKLLAGCRVVAAADLREWLGTAE